jgi:hypothetical protein
MYLLGGLFCKSRNRDLCTKIPPTFQLLTLSPVFAAFCVAVYRWQG